MKTTTRESCTGLYGWVTYRIGPHGLEFLDICRTENTARIGCEIMNNAKDTDEPEWNFIAVPLLGFGYLDESGERPRQVQLVVVSGHQ